MVPFWEVSASHEYQYVERSQGDLTLRLHPVGCCQYDVVQYDVTLTTLSHTASSSIVCSYLILIFPVFYSTFIHLQIFFFIFQVYLNFNFNFGIVCDFLQHKPLPETLNFCNFQQRIMTNNLV